MWAGPVPERVAAMERDGAQAFAEFYRTYFPAARRHAARLFGPADAEDIAQETMVRALAHFDLLRGGRPPWPWLATVVRNTGVDRWRRSRQVPVEWHVLDALAEPVPDPVERSCVPVEVAELLRRAWSLLTAKERRVLALHELQGLGLGEIAARTGISANTVRQRLFRARRNLGRHYRAAAPLTRPGDAAA